MNNEHKKYTITSGQEVSPEKLRTAREFRKNPTQAEANAWEWLRDRRCLGLKFRRQQVVHGFIVDFYCVELRLVLELDGGIHDDALDYDRDRDEVFSQMGIKVVRVRNEDCTQEKLTELVEGILDG